MALKVVTYEVSLFCYDECIFDDEIQKSTSSLFVFVFTVSEVILEKNHINVIYVANSLFKSLA